VLSENDYQQGWHLSAAVSSSAVLALATTSSAIAIRAR